MHWIKIQNYRKICQIILKYANISEIKAFVGYMRCQFTSHVTIFGARLENGGKRLTNGNFRNEISFGKSLGDSRLYQILGALYVDRGRV